MESITIFLWEMLYSLHGRNIVIVKQAIQDYIGMKKAILIK
jgi:hypothetical protein